MLTQYFSPGDSCIHRMAVGLKLGLLAAYCTFLLSFGTLPLLLVSLLPLAVAYQVAKIPAKLAGEAIKPAFWLLLILFLVQLYLSGWQQATLVVLRLAILILAASLLTLTTRAADLISGIEAMLSRVMPDRTAADTSLAISLSLRFIPMVRQTFEEVREAQQARGLGGDWLALATPVLLRTLRSADDIAEAITARTLPDETTSPQASKPDIKNE